MKSFRRNLYIFFKNGFISEQAWEHQMQAITEILQITESPEQFCTATELVDRNRITSNPQTILKEAKHFRLRPFRFLINKN